MQKFFNVLFVRFRKKQYFCIVNSIERHIEILLLSNDCVIVPNLGGFMAHHVDARFDGDSDTYLPPLRTLGFNPQLKMNDSLLVQSYIEAYDISYPEALRRIETEVKEIEQHLEAEGHYELNDLGVLKLNTDGKLEFEPCEAGILSPQLYGLSSVEVKLLSAEKEKNTEETGFVKTDAALGSTEQIQDNDHAIIIKMSWLRNIAAVAAAVLTFFMISSPVSNSSIDVQQSAFLPIPTVNQPTEEVDAVSDIVLQDEEMQVSAEPTEFYCIVLASQVSKRNADAFVEKLSKAGFEDARIMESTSMRRVVYGSFATSEEAHAKLKELSAQQTYFHDGWILKYTE